ncbi:putative mucin TcMUCI [Trypanosoma cruzi]|nr:putative mucin TcMUCI [Trypanosoma cruzi]
MMMTCRLLCAPVGACPCAALVRVRFRGSCHYSPDDHDDDHNKTTYYDHDNHDKTTNHDHHHYNTGTKYYDYRGANYNDHPRTVTLREIDGSLSSSAWVLPPLLLAASALAYATVG